MHFLKKFLGLLVLLMIPSAQAHMYVSGSPLYIRVVEHPEIKNIYSYGLCYKKNYGIGDRKRGVPMDQIRKQNHLHTDCPVPEGKFWWSLPDPKTYMKHDRSKKNLLDVLQEDDEGRFYLHSFEAATWILGWKAATAVTQKAFQKTASQSGIVKRTLRWLGQFFLNATIDTAVYVAFWEGGQAITEKATHDYHRKTQPFTEYTNWKTETHGFNQAGIEIDYKGRLQLPAPMLADEDQSCMDHCFENAYEIRNRLSYVYDPYSTLGLNLFANYTSDDPSFFETALKYRDYEGVCKLRCENHYRLPTMDELWFLVMTLLSKAHHVEYERVLWDYKKYPFSDSDFRITYMTPEMIAQRQYDDRFGGTCPIGSRCDQNYSFRYKGPLSLDQREFQKIDKSTLFQQYSKNVYQSLMGAQENAFTYHHVHDEQSQIRGYKDMIYFKTNLQVQQVSVYNAQGKSFFLDEYLYLDQKALEISSLSEQGMYYIVFHLEGDAQPLMHKVLVTP